MERKKPKGNRKVIEKSQKNKNPINMRIQKTIIITTTAKAQKKKKTCMLYTIGEAIVVVVV